MKTEKLLLAALVVALSIGFTACNTSDSSSPLAPTSTSSLDNTFFYSPDLTISDDPVENPTIMENEPPRDDRGGMRDDNPKGSFFPLGRIFQLLNLDSVQKSQIKGFLIIKGDCIKEQMLKLRESEAPILEAAKAKRDAVIADLKAGLITPEEARTALKAIKEETRAALEANPVREEVMAAVKLCEDAFLASVKSVLTEEQLAKWTEFQAKLDEWRNKRRPGHRG